MYKKTIIQVPVGGALLPGGWIELIYSASFLYSATRPTLVFTASDGAVARQPAPVPILGRAIWIGHVPRGTLRLDIESHGPLRLDKLTPLSLPWRLCAALVRRPRHALAAATLAMLGRTDRSSRRLMRALTERPLADYASWASRRRRLHEPDGLDRPEANAISMRDLIEVDLPPDEILTPYALDAVASIFASDPAITAIRGDSEIESASGLTAGFSSAWTPPQGAIFRRRGATSAVPTHVRCILSRHPPRRRHRPVEGSQADWPRVSVVVPTRDKLEFLRSCVDGVLRQTDYPALSLTIADNDSTDPATKAFLNELPALDSRVRVIPCPGAFNFSSICNRAALASMGEVLAFLNNDIAVTEQGWLKSLVRLAMKEDAGAVGPTLLFPDGKIQHAGIALGPGGTAGHILARKPASILDDIKVASRVSAVTGACLVVRRDRFDAVGGFDPAFAVSFNDVDLCLRLGARGWGAIWSPDTRLIHHESVSRRGVADDIAEVELFQRRWAAAIADDPCFHPVFSNAALDLSLG